MPTLADCLDLLQMATEDGASSGSLSPTSQLPFTPSWSSGWDTSTTSGVGVAPLQPPQEVSDLLSLVIKVMQPVLAL